MIFKVLSFFLCKKHLFSLTNEIKGDAKEVYPEILLCVFH